MNPTNLIISIIVILILGLILKEDTLSQLVKIILCANVSLVSYCALNIYSIEGFAGKKNKQSGEKTKNKQSGKKSKNKQSGKNSKNDIQQVQQQVQQQIDAQSSSSQLVAAQSTRLTQVESRLTEHTTQLASYLNRLTTVESQSSNNILPKGTIIMWNPPTSTTTPPTGWAYCDGSTIGTGSNSIITPDLRARFVLGANVKNSTMTNTNTLTTTAQNRVSTLPDSTTVAGQDKLTMTKTNVATSTHLHCTGTPATSTCNGGEAACRSTPANRTCYGDFPTAASTAASTAHVASIFSYQPPASITQPSESIYISIVPPYYALAYIMKIS